MELRQVLLEALTKEMEQDERIVSLDADLGKADGLLKLHERFPSRAFDVGIAEGNMAGIAAGMASYGMIPVINTFAAFATRRICDQIAISICYANQNVKIIGTDPGITAELNGGTHMTFEDIGVVRSIPGITILEPADEIELAQMVPAMLHYEGPVYMRLYRKNAPKVHDESYRFQLGRADVIRTGTEVSILCSGIMVSEAVTAAEQLAARGIDAEIINLHTVKPLDRAAVAASARKTGAVVVAENHNVLGGLGSAVAEVLGEEQPTRMAFAGVKDRKGEVGVLSYLREQFGLTAAEIVSAAEKLTAR